MWVSACVWNVDEFPSWECARVWNVNDFPSWEWVLVFEMLINFLNVS